MRACARLAALVLALGATPGAVHPGPARSSGLEDLCKVPPALKGVRGHLLFEYALDPAGKARDVQAIYAHLDPEKDRQAFVEALTQCVRDWGHQGTSAQGAAAGVIRWVPLHYFRPADAEGDVVVFPDGRSIPRPWAEEIRQEKVRLAAELMRGSRYRVVESAEYREIAGPGWKLLTDVGPQEARAFETALATAGRRFDAAFPGIPPVPLDGTLTVLYFQSGTELDAVHAFDNFTPRQVQLAGSYTGFDRMITAVKEDLPLPIASGVLVHEATHHLVAERLFAGRRRPPVWLDEGIACFIQCLKEGGEGEIDFAALERGKIIRLPSMWSLPAEEMLRRYREAALKGGQPPLPLLLGGAGEESFRSSDPKPAYAAAWLLIHYLMNADGGKYREPLRAWLRGSGPDQGVESLAAAVGKPIVEIEAELPIYVEGLK